MSSLQRELLKNKLPPLGSLLEDDDAESSSGRQERPVRRINQEKYRPEPWSSYFESSDDIKLDDSAGLHTFRVYRAGPIDSKQPVFVMHHGAGHSGLSFALTAHHIRIMTHGQCSIIAIDARGHGDTRTGDDNDFSLARMSNDLVAVLEHLFADREVDFILVGHSMGGSVVTDVAHSKRLRNVVGVAVLDVVEGSAMDALASMTKILSTRPQRFSSVEQAIQWHVQSETLRNLSSAKVSVPPLIHWTEDQDCYKWRTDLTKTTPFWTEWFENLSPKFLACSAAKLLILAGTDRLDKPLTIAQMQGKFQLHIIPEAGHFLQEDEPQRTAQCLVEFWHRNRRLVLPPKVQVTSKKPTEEHKR